jgi:hypothetical protein
MARIKKVISEREKAIDPPEKRKVIVKVVRYVSKPKNIIRPLLKRRERKNKDRKYKAIRVKGKTIYIKYINRKIE